MKKNHLTLIISLLLLFVCLTVSAQQKMMFGDTSRVGVPYSKDPEVVNFKGRYLMYYSIPPRQWNNMEGWNIGIAESKDLVNWEKVGEITPQPGLDYEKKGLCAPGALVKDGKVHLFYQTYGNGPKDAICHAVSNDGINFERDKTNPIFHPEVSDWSCGRAIDAEVAYFKGNYYLYFATRDPEFKIQKLGVAVTGKDSDFSRDSWKLAANKSILYPLLPWEGECTEGASVTVKNGKMYLFYAGAYNNAPQQIGYAVSDDGINFTRTSPIPFKPNGKEGEWNHSESGHPHIFTDLDGRTYLFYQGNNDNGRTWKITQEEVLWQLMKKNVPTIPWLQSEADRRKEERHIFDEYDEIPHIVGDKDAIAKIIKDNMNYPEKAKKKNIGGKVIVMLDIDIDGSTGNYKVIKTSNKCLNEEALRLARLVKFERGKNQFTKCKFNIPITFKLNESN